MPGRVKLPKSVVDLPGATGVTAAPGLAKKGTTGINAAFQPPAVTGAALTGAAAVQLPVPVALPGDQFGEANQLPTQLTGRDAVRTPGQLTSNLGGISDPNALPERLEADLAIHLPELVSVLSLTRQQKASRLVNFLVPYAAKLAQLSAAAALPAQQRVQLEQKLLTPMSNAGLQHVVELTTGKSGLEVARELLRATSPEQAHALTGKLSFDAPTWASRPETALANEVKRGEPSLIAHPNLQQPRDLAIGARANVEDEPNKKDRPDKVLGKNMVWNVLHMFGDFADGPIDEKKKNELVMATGGIIVLVITVALVIVLALVLGK